MLNVCYTFDKSREVLHGQYSGYRPEAAALRVRVSAAAELSVSGAGPAGQNSRPVQWGGRRCKQPAAGPRRRLPSMCAAHISPIFSRLYRQPQNKYLFLNMGADARGGGDAFPPPRFKILRGTSPRNCDFLQILFLENLPKVLDFLKFSK